MKRIIGTLMTCILFFSLVVSIQADSLPAPQVSERDTETTVISQATEDENFEAGIVLVTLKKKSTVINKKHSPSAFKGVRVDSVTDLSRIVNEEAMNWIDKDNYHQILKLELKDKSKSAVLDAIKKLEKRNDVLRATPNYIFTLDEGLPEEDGAEPEGTPTDEDEHEGEETIPSATPSDPNTTQYVLNKMQLPQAWNLTTGSQAVTVGVLDSGIDPNHEDLKANLNTSLGQNYTDDGLAAWTDPVGHGTHVAGIIGAVGNNNKGIAGVCWNVKLVSIRVFKRTYDENGNIKGTGYLEWVADAINYAINHQIPILNFSGSGTGVNDDLSDAISNYPGLLVCSAGNGKDHDNNDKTPNIPVDMDTDSLKFYPACYPNDNIISVANTTSSDQLASTSNYGATTVDLGAPGSNIYSTIPGGSYDYKSGTSMASPQVAGVAALIKSVNPSLTAEQIKTCILDTVDPVNALTGKCVTGGRLNAYKAVNAAKSQYKMVDGSFVSGDFNGDGRLEIAAFYGMGNRMDLVVWDDYNRSFDMTKGRIVCSSDQFSTDPIKNKVVAGDFDGDGKDEICAFYDYGNNHMGLWRFIYVNDNYFSVRKVCDSTEYDAACITGRVVAGDFDSNGRDEIVVFFELANNRTGVWMFYYVNNSQFLATRTNIFADYDASRITGRVVAGDFDGDGKCNIGAFFDYGSGKMALWKMSYDAVSKFTAYKVCESDQYPVNGITYRVTAGDYDGDGKCDIGAFYDYGGSVMSLWKFNGSTANITAGKVVSSDQYSVSRITGRVVSGDFDGDGLDEIDALYDHNNNRYGLWRFEKVNSGYTSSRIWIAPAM